MKSIKYSLFFTLFFWHAFAPVHRTECAYEKAIVSTASTLAAGIVGGVSLAVWRTYTMWQHSKAIAKAFSQDPSSAISFGAYLINDKNYLLPAQLIEKKDIVLQNLDKNLKYGSLKEKIFDGALSKDTLLAALAKEKSLLEERLKYMAKCTAAPIILLGKLGIPYNNFQINAYHVDILLNKLKTDPSGASFFDKLLTSKKTLNDSELWTPEVLKTSYDSCENLVESLTQLVNAQEHVYLRAKRMLFVPYSLYPYTWALFPRHDAATKNFCYYLVLYVRLIAFEHIVTQSDIFKKDKKIHDAVARATKSTEALTRLTHGLDRTSENCLLWIKEYIECFSRSIQRLEKYITLPNTNLQAVHAQIATIKQAILDKPEAFDDEKKALIAQALHIIQDHLGVLSRYTA